MESGPGAGEKEERMIHIKRAALLAAAVLTCATMWATPLQAGERQDGRQQAPQEAEKPVEVENGPEKEKEWQFEPIKELSLDPEMQIYMYEVCEEYGLSFAFAAMMMESESQFNAAAIGDGGESIGYFQINRVNWERMANEYGLDAHDNRDNIKCGVILLSELFEKQDDAYWVILCYKCGERRGRELYEQQIYTTSQFDCEALCNRAAEIERAMGI